MWKITKAISLFQHRECLFIKYTFCVRCAHAARSCQRQIKLRTKNNNKQEQPRKICFQKHFVAVIGFEYINFSFFHPWFCATFLQGTVVFLFHSICLFVSVNFTQYSPILVLGYVFSSFNWRVVENGFHRFNGSPIY